MRWDALFADMELQLAAQQTQDRQDQVAELTRAERAGVLLVDRFRAAQGTALGVTLRSVTVTGVVRDVGPVWVLLEDGPRELLVPLHAVVTVAGMGRTVRPPAGAALRALTLGHALRAVSRDRSLVRVTTMAGVLTGRVDVVAADHLELAVTYPDSGRPTGDVRIVPTSALELVASA